MLRKPDSGGQTVMAAERIVPIDRARTLITLLVVLHHSVINYTYFGMPTGCAGSDSIWSCCSMTVLHGLHVFHFRIIRS